MFRAHLQWEQQPCLTTQASVCPLLKTVPRDLLHKPLPEASSNISHVTLYFKYMCPSVDCLLCRAVELSTQQEDQRHRKMDGTNGRTWQRFPTKWRAWVSVSTLPWAFWKNFKKVFKMNLSNLPSIRKLIIIIIFFCLASLLELHPSPWFFSNIIFCLVNAFVSFRKYPTLERTWI